MKSYPEQRMLGISYCSHDWILWLDADERVPPTLRQEMQTRLATDANRYSGYYILRQEFLLGRRVKYTDWGARYYWGRTHHLRVFRKDGWIFKADQKVHERLEGEGPVGRLYCPLHHTNANPNLDARFDKIVRYARLEAAMKYQRGLRVRWYDFIFRPVLGFLKSFVWFRGFVDGVNGWIIAWCSLITEVHVCSYLYEKQQGALLEARKDQIQGLWRVS
jgi:glycosyltransferase involved in cell wall biosynthesis